MKDFDKIKTYRQLERQKKMRRRLTDFCGQSTDMDDDDDWKRKQKVKQDRKK